MDHRALTILFSVILMLLGNTLQAQDDYYVDIEISNKNPSVNEQFRIDYRLKFKGSSGTFNLSGLRAEKPDFKGFRIIDEGGSMDMNMGFGRRQEDMPLYKYSFILEAKKAGQYTISPFAFQWQGKTFRSGELNITVSKAEDVKKPSRAKKEDDGVDAGQVFARTNITKQDVYKGEPLIVTHKLYAKNNITGLNVEGFPSYSGFWSEDVDIGELKVKRERIDNEVYNVVTIGKKILFPQKSGQLEIGDFAASLNLEVIRTRKPRSRMEQYMHGNRVRFRDNIKKTLRSPPVQVNVKPLPQTGRPSGFSGHVGSYRMSSELTKDSINLNQGTNLKITLSGSGNIKLLESPEPDMPPGFEIYDPDVHTHTEITGGGISGSRTFDYLIIPDNTGTYKIPSVRFTYYDILKEEYVTLESEAYEITVGEKGDATSGGTAIQTYGKEEVRRLGSDIMYIYESPVPLSSKNTFFTGSWFFWVLLLLPVIALLVFIIRYKQNQKIRNNVDLMRTRKATRLARKRLKRARSLKNENKQQEFFEELNRALLCYLSDRFNISMAELSRERIKEKLKASHIKEDFIDQCTRLLDDCDYARFAPNPGKETRDKLYEDAANLISQIERELK
ncbi:MAG: BatD family protein [Bacteroidales bacterium]